MSDIMRLARVRSPKGRARLCEYMSDSDIVSLVGTLKNVEGLRRRERTMKFGSFAPLVSPSAIFGVGLNYKCHAQETGKQLPKYPMIFMKSPGSMLAHKCAVSMDSAISKFVDYEAELAVIIGGKPVKNATVSNALSHVLGYACANDVTARDWQAVEKGGGQFVRAKSFDGFCPVGPCFTLAQYVPDPQALEISCKVNGVTVQKSTTANMIFSVAELISFISQGTTISPWSVILTGTPAGVGFAKKPPSNLLNKDIVDVEISGIGTLSNSFSIK